MSNVTRKPMAAANWKMNGNRALVESFAKALWAEGVERVFALPATLLPAAQAQGLSALAGQDVSAHENGAHTGEVSATLLKETGCTYAVIGHSERRTDFQEDEALLIKKWKQLQDQGITPIYCIGESLEEYDNGTTAESLVRQLQPILDADLLDENSVIAYEPVWAIGTGKAATAEYAQQVHAEIRTMLAKKSATIACSVRLLYGGSVKPDNAKALFAGADIDGFLVGGASLKVDDFQKIVEAMV